MHGIVFAELKKFTEAKFGDEAWPNLLAEAGLGSKVYLSVDEYPDSEVVALVGAASRITGWTADAVLTAFGEFLSKDLLGMYRGLLKPNWRALDVIEHTESTIHKVVRLRNPGAKPPELIAERAGPDEVIVNYSSKRRLCSLAKGLAVGIGKQFDETLVVSESQCMNKGAASCRLSIKKVS